jgi:hypothetical protein
VAHGRLAQAQTDQARLRHHVEPVGGVQKGLGQLLGQRFEALDGFAGGAVGGADINSEVVVELGLREGQRVVSLGWEDVVGCFGRRGRSR